MAKLFNEQTPQETPQEFKADDFVGEGKKYATVDDLAKAIYHANQHINNLEQENNELREDRKLQASLQETLAEIKRQQADSIAREQPRQPEPSGSPNVGDDKPSQFSPEDIEKIVNQRLNDFQNQSKQEQNVQYVVSELEKNWGNDYGTKLRQVAKELGRSEDDLQMLAQNDPVLFLAAVGGNRPAQRQDDPSAGLPPRSGLQSTNLQSTSKRNNAFYEKMRKEDPDKFHSKEVQRQRWADAKAMGGDFWNS